VQEGDVLAVLDDIDYRLAEEAASQQLIASKAQARQAESDRKRLEALKADGSVSAADEEQAQTRAQQTKAAAEADKRKLELARNRLNYTVLRAPRSGVVTVVRAEVGQVVAEGQPVVSIAAQGEPEIVIDVPEDHFASFKEAQYKAWLATAPDETFDVSLRELSLQAAQQTRTYRARLKPAIAPLRSSPSRRARSPRRRASRRCGSYAAPERSRWARLISCKSRPMPTATTRCSSPGRQPACWSSPPGCRRWRPDCASR
jgi:RND family efflux transporter MFP subunit